MCIRNWPRMKPYFDFSRSVAYPEVNMNKGGGWLGVGFGDQLYVGPVMGQVIIQQYSQNACFLFRFGAFEYFKNMSVDDRGNLSPSKRMLCGLGKC